MTAARRYDGVLKIVRYNVHYYAVSLGALLAIAAAVRLQLLPRAGQAVLIGAGSLIAFWFLSSLAASYYIYDYVGLTRWEWVPQKLLFPPRRWLNIHVGLDESSTILVKLFPKALHVVLDVYDPQDMTERSIARARMENRSAEPANVCKLDRLALPDQDRDTIFLLFSAHEIRQATRRAAFFVELSRVLTNSGQLLLVEHLRDWKNFVAFGPGFMHFHSRREWLQTARETDLTVVRENRLTPLVSCFVMSKGDA